MSLARLMLRALAINALSPQDDDRDLITMAGERVFDSMLDPKQLTVSAQDIPAITVYTDEDDGDLLARQANAGPYARHVNLRVEIVIGTFDVNAQTSEAIFALPTTDAQLEAQLDLFEQQVRWALLDYPARSATSAFKAFVVQISHISSHVQRDESGNNRFAARVLVFKCKINDDCSLRWGLTDDPESERMSFDEEDFTQMPPWLRPMLVVSQRSPSMLNVIEALGGYRSPVVLLPLFKRMGFRSTLNGVATPPTLWTVNPQPSMPLSDIGDFVIGESPIGGNPLGPAYGPPITDPNFDIISKGGLTARVETND